MKSDKYLSNFAFVALMSLVIFGTPFQGVAQLPVSSMSFRAYIDGSDYIHVKDTEVWYVHRNFQLPGLWNGHNEATFINGAAWYPSWSDGTSNKYNSLDPPLASAGISDVNVEKLEGRGSIDLVQTPEASNDYEAVILIDDDAEGGPDWYTFKLTWRGVKVTLNLGTVDISNVGVGDDETTKKQNATMKIVATTTPSTTGLTIKFNVDNADPNTNDKGYFYNAADQKTEIAQEGENGEYELYYRAKEETTNDKCYDNPMLQPQLIQVSASIDNKKMAETSFGVLSRFNFLKLPPSRYNEAIKYVETKYKIDFPFYSTQTFTSTPIPGASSYTDGLGQVHIGPQDVVTENELASTLIHERVHVYQGPDAALQMTAGRKLYNVYRSKVLGSNGENFFSVQQIRTLISNWAIYELQAYFEQKRYIYYVCLSTSEIERLDENIKHHCDILMQFSGTSCTDVFKMTDLSSRSLARVNTVIESSGVTRIYPNPSTGSLTIGYNSAANGKIELKVYDMLGRIVFSQSDRTQVGNNTYNLNLSYLSTGSYYLELSNGGKSQRSKIIIQE